MYRELGVKPLAEGQRRCAKPPYDSLPIPRADIPAGIILSRDADAWIREDEIPEVTFTDATGKPLKVKVENEDGEKEELEVIGPAVALPLYEGRMIGQFDFSQKGWVSGKGRSAEWRDIPWEQKRVEPQFLLGDATYRSFPIDGRDFKVGIMDVTSATNSRTMIATPLGCAPTGHKVPTLSPINGNSTDLILLLASVLDTFSFDYLLRNRLGGLSVVWAALAENAVPTQKNISPALATLSSRLVGGQFLAYPRILRFASRDRSHVAAVTPHERLRTRLNIEAIVYACYGLDADTVRWLLYETDLPRTQLSDRTVSKRLNPKGFWRVDKGRDTEQRQTVLSIIAFDDLQHMIARSNGDVAKGIEAFCSQNEGEGWMLPETLRLADYGLGHDDRANEHQPVRECFGPRFYDWQLAQTPEESWKECHLHARNLLGPAEYEGLLDELAGRPVESGVAIAASKTEDKRTKDSSSRLFE